MSEQLSTPWPAERWPTPDEWVGWFINLSPDEQDDVVARHIESAQAAHRCFVANHDGFPLQLESMRDALLVAEERAGVAEAKVAAVEAWSKNARTKVQMGISCDCHSEIRAALETA